MFIFSCFYGCGFSSGTEIKAQTNSISETADSLERPQSFFESWNGEEIDPETAEENGGIFLNSQTETASQLWNGFVKSVNKQKRTEMNFCTENSIINVNCTEGTEYKANITIRTKENGSISETSRTISPAKIRSRYNKDKKATEYFISDCLIYLSPNKESDCEEIPLEFKTYTVNSDAGITFPYEKTFSSYSDFEKYYKKYNDELGLDEIKADMKAFDEQGGFNAHVVFLCGDMTVSGGGDYTLLSAVRQENSLTIYVKKRSGGKGEGKAEKCQLTAAVQSEYLVDVSPECISWVIFSE